MSVLIIDYGSGNLHSVHKAFQQQSQKYGLTASLTCDPQALTSASHIVLPGVGAYDDCMRGLQAINGMIDALHDAVLNRRIPFFGICVGMQLMCEKGLEFGEHKGLGWIPGVVAPLQVPPALRIPHMGWNALNIAKPNHPVFADIPEGVHLYFVHSFAAAEVPPDAVLATADYGSAFTAMIGRDNMVGTQFHPEKSGEAGLKLIDNFLRI